MHLAFLSGSPNLGYVIYENCIERCESEVVYCACVTRVASCCQHGKKSLCRVKDA
jgi:hypothetical protein